MEFETHEFFALDGNTAPKTEATSPLARLQYLVDNTRAVIYCSVPSGDFKMTFVSNNAVDVLGHSPEEMTADPNFWFDHIHPDDSPQIFSSLAQLFVEGQRTYEYRFRTADGRYLWMHDSLRLIRDSNGTPVEVIGSLTDITARKELEEQQQLLIVRLQEAQEQLLQSEKMASIGQLAAGVAHEINNPIGFVNSNMTSLQKYVRSLCDVVGEYEQAVLKSPDKASLEARLRELRQAADLDFLIEDVNALVNESMDGLKRVRDIVQSLKDFSHIGETEWQMADIHNGLDSTLNIVANEIKYKATVVKEYGQVPPIRCLASQLNQVFMNMLVNAAQAIATSGTITIRTHCEDGWVSIEFEDTGSGIAPEHLKHVFEPFFTTKPVGSGTGLGLSLSYGIINKHGGRIDVSSTPGVGTRFTIHLPAATSI